MTTTTMTTRIVITKTVIVIVNSNSESQLLEHVCGVVVMGVIVNQKRELHFLHRMTVCDKRKGFRTDSIFKQKGSIKPNTGTQIWY